MPPPRSSKQSRSKRKASTPPHSPRPPLTARTADRYDLYQRSVQNVEAEIDFVDRMFLKHTGRRARTLREDFCGTFGSACEWVRRRRTNIAVGLDLDPEPIAWGRAHNLTKLDDDQQSRVTILRGNVLAPPRTASPSRVPARFDTVLAMNFSYWTFRTREQLGDYFRAVRRSLAPDGVFFLDFFGGSDVLCEMKETTRHGRWSYIWDQQRYNPVTGDLTCHIHFKFKDGTMLRRAFTYHWRLWTIPELRDLLRECGFPKLTVYCEGDDGNGGGNGIFRATESTPADRCFIAYLVAE